MKCEFCAGNLTLEDEFCPHCGQPNKHAKKHIDDMKRFEGEFQETKKYVYEKTGLYTAVAVRAVIIAVLLIFNVLFWTLAGNVWEVKWQWQKITAEWHYDEYSKQLDQYLADEDYLGFYSFCQAKNIRTYDTKYEDKYELVQQLCSSYSYTYEALISYVNNQNVEYYNTAETLVGMMDSFYRYYLDEDDFYTNLYGGDELFREAADVMKYNIDQVLITYGGLTPEEAAALPDMSKARRAILLEERREERQRNE